MSMIDLRYGNFIFSGRKETINITVMNLCNRNRNINISKKHAIRVLSRTGNFYLYTEISYTNSEKNQYVP